MKHSEGRILVAEDDELIRMLMIETLHEAGFEVLEAGDGAKALTLLEEPDHVRMIVTDINMPGIDGIEMAKRVQASHPGMPVIFASARPDLLQSRDLPEPYRFLAKPYAMRDLTLAVKDMLD